MYNTDIVIIGSGPVGLFAVFQAGMLGMKCHVIDAQEVIGGQCITLYPEKHIYDIPAYPKITAKELIEQLKSQAAPFNPVYHLNQQAIELNKHNDFFEIKTSKNTIIKSKVIIIAAGAGAFGPNKPPLANIEDFEGKSIFYFINDKSKFLGKNIVVAGGGDSAVDWTIALSEIANKIYLVHRRDKFTAATESIRQLRHIAETGKIELVTGYQLNNLDGHNNELQAVIVKDLQNNIRKLDANILLPFFGLKQDLGPLANWGLNVKLQHIEVDNYYYQTNIKGIYAIGDVAHYVGKLKLIITGFAEAAHSINHAYSRVFDGKALHFEYSTNKYEQKQ
ncbi:NAD(P)/FAD-dependent oxidoreductase [Rickettsia typhi]|uniref:Ferredoxin--NADP reductase n=2 Tax=Rickettsia typhi TaxID=785 RepID=FENR_RICTY|nr:NAD(P)/FAD-dependent oxidoreductase [Rickettsia typhi]Q68WM0.1 RecName: Full=Ferredoxin--NADP reductase; Short=FNR; Short=Fd-NADP(+) reductase [Rickettsia typhi str. Wilmington]AAU03972.1 NADP-thioredoxin reductase [Rickettsia typhi str. Wilmington]AFE54353.1 thioredoxin reductase [Rickettsia typhi str. TH1527]AFE55191.1 thioredoxin reductase [Rickettsia typhi str. B9991CWPP]